MFFTNYNYDIVIIGGGIAGLFTAFKLADTGFRIIILESSDRLGGRIKTVTKKNISFEAGAARIHNTHGKILSLIDDLNLSDELIQLPEKFDHILRNKKEDFPYQTKDNLDLDELLMKAFTLKKNYDEDILVNITFFQYLIMDLLVNLPNGHYLFGFFPTSFISLMISSIVIVGF